MALTLLWTLLTATLWMTGSSQTLGSDPVKILYPRLDDAEIIDCECPPLSCEQVAWFRMLYPTSDPGLHQLQFLGRANKADRVTYGPEVQKEGRFLISKKGGTGYSLRVLNVSQKDRGAYACVFKDRKNEELWRNGVVLLPGELPPTEAPQKKNSAPSRPSCPCTHQDSGGCAALVLWPLVGLTSALGLSLLCVLYYYSRLPKKCRHRFVKKK